ncbi:MAG: hypothetical protein JW888_03745 [Pirellulales bacterium]|nr:hypothetical protein [Pirellulales bacterium]
MLNPRYVGVRSAIVLVVVLAFGTTPALGICTQVVHDSQPSVCPSCCCTGPCVCVANTSQWGYHATQWRPWPGDQVRQDIVFPQSIGVERIATPRGAKPKPLPREQYAKRKTKAERDAEAATNIRIRDGSSVVPAESPWPFELGPEFNQDPEGIDFGPQGPSPE